jgi:hypothetical protein
MLKVLRLFILALLFIIWSCSDDEIKIDEEILIEETNPEEVIAKLASINLTSIMIDSAKNLMLYNGVNLEFDSLVVVNKDTFDILPNDSELFLGKKYQLIKNNESYNFYRTEIPLIILDTEGSEIPDEPKIGGTIKILDDGEIDFQGFIGIERRGGFSQTFPKKSYGIELWEDINGEDDVKESLLELRKDDDWILDALWNEPLRVRDYTAHEIWLSMARYNYSVEEPETVLGINRNYAEVFLNGAYRGIYYLGERVDRKQLNLKDFEDKLRGELYKGVNLALGTGFQGLDEFSNAATYWSGYEAEYPDDIGELDWTNLHDLVDFVVNSSEEIFDAEIGTRLDMENAVDYFIFLNITYAIDNTGKNLYTARYNQETPYFFVAWDLDGTFGNSWTGERLTDSNNILTNGLYERLISNPIFVAMLKERWAFLKSDVLSETTINSKFVDNYNFLKGNGVYERERMDETLPFNYSDTEIEYITSWNSSRRVFLDNYINGL